MTHREKKSEPNKSGSTFLDMYCYMKKCTHTAINMLFCLEKELKRALEELEIVSCCGVVDRGSSEVG